MDVSHCGNQQILITVTKALPEEKPVLGNLLKMYCHEWSRFTGFDVDERGMYEYENHVSDYWNRENHYPFLIRTNGKLAGFVLVDDDFGVHPDYDHAMSEFFVMEKYRRTGVGRYAARTVFDMLPGKWEIKCHPDNVASVGFWRSVVGEYADGDYEFIESRENVTYHDGTCATFISFGKWHALPGIPDGSGHGAAVAARCTVPDPEKEHAMPEEERAGAIIYAMDIRQVGGFYSRVADLRIADEKTDHLRMESRLFELIVVGIPPHIASTITIGSPPAVREDTPVKLAFPVASIEKARILAAENGGELLPEGHEWIFRGHRVCDGHDPEGNVFQVTMRMGHDT